MILADSYRRMLERDIDALSALPDWTAIPPEGDSAIVGSSDDSKCAFHMASLPEVC